MAKDDETRWTGHDLYDEDGDKIGRVDDVRFGDMTGGLTWLVVKTGFLGTKKILVPANDVRRSDDHLVVPFDKDVVKDAPHVDDETLLDDEQRKLCTYYGLDYVASRSSQVEGCAEDEG